MKRDVLQSAENYAKAHRSRKRWYRLVAGLACVVVFCTVYALILPAITMTNNPKLEAEKTQAALGDALTLCFSVEPDAGAQQTVFYLSAKQDNAGLDVDFDSQNTARIAAENGTEIQLHRQLETDGTVGYWFALSGEAQAATLKLPWINGAQQIRPASTASQPQSGDTGATAEYTEQTSAAEESSADYVEVPAGTDISETEAPAEPAETAISEEETMGDAPAGETAAAEEAASVKETAAVSAAEPEAAAVKEESAVADAAYGALVYENGDPAEAGSVTLTAGSGATLEEAKKAANDADNSVTLRWQTEQTTDSDKNANTGHKAALPQEVEAEGTIDGTEISWSLTKSLSGKYTLTISGTGAMPNYTSGRTTPWWSYVNRYRTTDLKVNLVIGEGITSVGQYCFHQCRLASVSLPQSLTRIRGNAFKECLGFTSIEIPANVTVVEGNSFYEANHLKTVVLHEGLQSIGPHAFRANAITTLELPSTLVNWSNAAVNCQGSLKEITVAEGNPSLAVVDNALYRLNAASDTYELVLYASGSMKKALTIPETINGKKVTSIIAYSFYASSYPKEVTIPSSVNKIESYSFQNSSVGKVTLESTFLSNSKYAFINAGMLTEIDFSNLQGIIPEMFLSSTAIQTITIPEEVTSFGHNFLSETTYLKNIYYDAKSAGARNGTPLGTSHCTYTLTIGPHVDTLQKTFYHFAQYAENIAFEGPNQITITEGAMAGAPAPFTDLSGTVYVDGQGLIYLYDQIAGTAELIYCPPEVQQATVPAAITPEDGITCTVTAVRKDALKWAKDLQSIDFEAPDKIERLADYAMANCTNLASVNGRTTVDEATASFPNAQVGYNVFYNTGLTGAGGMKDFVSGMRGRKSLSITKAGATSLEISVASGGGTMEWVAAGEDTEVGGYRLLTGDTLTVTASTGNNNGSGGNRYRLYFQLTGEEGSTNLTPGTEYTFDGQSAVCHATEDPYTVYLEFAPEVGATMSVPVSVVYPSPTSAGGGMTAWAVILTSEEAAANQDRIVASSQGIIRAYWTTKSDDFALTKTNGNNTDIQVTSDGNGGMIPASNPAWSIQLKRAAQTVSAYGKDYAKSADFTDTLVLPENVSWKGAVKTAVQEGNVTRYGTNWYAGDIWLFSLTLSSNSTGLSISNARATWDEELDTVAIHWQVTSYRDSAEMNTFTAALTIAAQALSVDTTGFAPNSIRTLSNTVTAAVHYHYGDDQGLTAKAARNLTIKAGAIKLAKGGSSTQYFGENVNYTLKLYNDGALPWTGSATGAYTLRDDLPQTTYIRPENLQKMFEAADNPLTSVDINYASLAGWEAVAGVDGETAWRNSGNSDLASEQHKIRISSGENGEYTAQIYAGVDTDQTLLRTESAATVQQLLQSIGYAVTGTDQYICKWMLNDAGSSFTLSGGESSYFYVYATVKNTFQLVTQDYPTQYPSASNVSLVNQANVFTPSGGKVSGATASCTNYAKREASIGKSVWRNGEAISSSPSANNGDVLEYHLDFTHFGSGSYENLPMVDDLYGSQYLLVPAALNPELGALDTCEDTDGTVYYKLKEGVYRNVWVGTDDEGNDLLADSITVTRADGEDAIEINGESRTYTGLHTQIKWYFPKLEGGEYVLTVTYKALVDLKLTGVNYTIGNVVWMIDKPGNRIFASIWGGGTLIDFHKDIVTTTGESPEQDEMDEDGYCVVEPGDRVTYRLTLENSGDGYFCLNGADLADALPDNMGVFRWEKDVNLTDFRIETQGDGIAYSNLDQWYLADSYGGLLGDRQYILWPDTASITFHSPGAVYLYFTLTYPEDTETSQDWSLYAAANRGNILDNTMYVYLYPSTVTHDLREMGQVVLQKGVYGLFRNGQSPYKITGNSRLYYNNRDSSSRAIAYYVILYNGGNSRLYLSDLYDKLPNGFSYRNMLTEGCAGGTLNAVASPAKTTGGLNSGTSPLVKVDAEDVVYRSATISAANSGGVLRFSFDAGSGDYAVKYSEEMQQYYLDRGEAIVFGYVCDIGLAENTEDSATNTIAMAYTDYLDSGLTVIDQNSLPVRAAESDTFVDFNDGGRLTKSGLQVQEDYGFGDGGAQTWLISDVTVIRGGIIPGVTKYTESYTNTSNIVAAYTNSVGPYDTVNWRVRLHNSGTLSVTDYVFTDIMPAPYAYEGAVTVKICGADGSSWKSATLLTFPSGRTGAETQLTVTYAGKTVTVPLNGSWVSLDSGTQISMEKDEKGNEVLQIHFADPKMSIPEGGYVDVCLSSRNPTTSYQNTVYTNQAILTPQAQRFSTVQQGSMVRDAEGNPVGAKNSSPVTVSFGYATTSEKRVTETADESNTAVSTDPENNFILLPQADDSFTYSLVVNNDTEKYMTKLVLIDNLPEVGDHSPFETSTSRGSEFKVSLADTPDFTVTVTTANGDSYTLPSEYYTVQYSTTTDFGGAQSADWKGENTQTTALWTQNPAGARSFRIIITDPEATQIPDQSEIAVTFQARVDGEANPGDVAWNSFGYHYALKDITVELESMPQVVGVKIPSIPEFSKTLMDLSGKPVEAETEETFHFLLYQGPSLSRRYATAEELIQVLNENGYDYRQFDATIPGGQNTSDRIRLSLDPWDWQTGEQYTIVELPTSEDYVFRSFNGSSMAYYTFTYDPAQKRAITCENTYEKWTIRITKESINGEALPGAVFALYSPSEEDQVPVPGEYAGLSVEPTVEVSGQNWYLAGISASGTDGVLEWTDLTQKSYYLLEIKAPDGYHLTKQTGQVLYQAGSDGGVYALTIVNEADYELPETGGDGTTLYTIGGLLLMAVAGILLYMYFKRRKEDVTAS
ncbi:MAG: leucine-rich repeat protein [Candidatus Faecousia sp.]|nr:leucine-rich repeat protein [Candidatus Faecousia sp.]